MKVLQEELVYIIIIKIKINQNQWREDNKIIKVLQEVKFKVHKTKDKRKMVIINKKL